MERLDKSAYKKTNEYETWAMLTIYTLQPHLDVTKKMRFSDINHTCLFPRPKQISSNQSNPIRHHYDALVWRHVPFPFSSCQSETEELIPGP